MYCAVIRSRPLFRLDETAAASALRLFTFLKGSFAILPRSLVHDLWSKLTTGKHDTVMKVDGRCLLVSLRDFKKIPKKYKIGMDLRQQLQMRV